MKLLDCPFPELLGEPALEPEYVWRSGVILLSDHPLKHSDDRTACGCLTEVGAWRRRATAMRHPSHKIYSSAPFRQTLADAIANAIADKRSAFFLFDDDGKELRRWDLRGHRGEGGS